MESERAERLRAPPFIDPPGYARHRPEATLLYQLVVRHYPQLVVGIGVEADQREKLERLTRYMSRPPVAIERLALSAQGQVRYRLKTRYRDGTAERPTPRHVAMTWARRLQRVFGIDLERCARCGGRLTVIASIEEPALIARILAHRRERGAEDSPVASLGARAPPPGSSGWLF